MKGHKIYPLRNFSTFLVTKFILLLQSSCSVVSDSLWPHGLQHARLLCSSPSPRACSNSCPSSRWCHPSHLILCHPILPLPSIFPSIRVFSNESALWIRWSIGASASASVLLVNIQDWFPLGLTGLILQSKGLSRVFSSTKVWKHQFFGAQLSLQSNFSSLHDYWKNHSFD